MQKKLKNCIKVLSIITILGSLFLGNINTSAALINDYGQLSLNDNTVDGGAFVAACVNSLSSEPILATWTGLVSEDNTILIPAGNYEVKIIDITAFLFLAIEGYDFDNNENFNIDNICTDVHSGYPLLDTKNVTVSKWKKTSINFTGNWHSFENPLEVSTTWSTTSTTDGTTGFKVTANFPNFIDRQSYNIDSICIDNVYTDSNADKIYEKPAGSYLIKLPISQNDCSGDIGSSETITVDNGKTTNISMVYDYSDYSSTFNYENLIITSSTSEIDKVFKDVPTSNNFAPYIFNLKTNGIIGGYGDGTFRPANLVSRGEMSVFITRSFLSSYGDTSCGDFSDLKDGNPFYYEATVLKCLGVISGSGGKFNSKGYVSRGAAMKFIINSLEGNGYSITDPGTVNQPDVAGNTFETYIRKGLNDGIISGYGDGTFKPNKNVSRAEMAIMVDKARRKIGGIQVEYQAENKNINPTDSSQISDKDKENILKRFKLPLL